MGRSSFQKDIQTHSGFWRFTWWVWCDFGAGLFLHDHLLYMDQGEAVMVSRFLAGLGYFLLDRFRVEFRFMDGCKF